MKLLMALMVSVVLALAAFGTAQVPDKLILDGKEVPLFENPLEFLWVDEAGTPVLFSEAYLEPAAAPTSAEERAALEAKYAKRPRRPQVFDEGSMSSANWRGYMATWTIESDRLLLVKVAQEHQTKPVPKNRKDRENWRPKWEMREIPIERILPGKTLPVFAEWYSGRLKIPQGEMTRYVHMGYGSEYERELLIEIKNGVVVARAEISTAGKNEFRSVPDLQWCALGQEVEDKGDWVDVRLLATRRLRELINSGEEFRTRGVFFRHNDSKVAASLVVFETRKTKADNFPIHKLPAGVAVKDGSHVEVTARFVVVGEVPELQVSAIRELKGGESMHAASFPAEWEALQAEASAEKAAEAKKVAEPAK